MTDRWSLMTQGDARLLAFLSNSGVAAANVTEAIAIVRREHPPAVLPGLLAMLSDTKLNWHARWMISLMFRGPWVASWADQLLEAFKANAMAGEAQVCGAISHSLESVAGRFSAGVVLSVMSDPRLPEGFGAALVPVLARTRDCSQETLEGSANDRWKADAVRREMNRLDRRIASLAKRTLGDAPWSGEEWGSTALSDESLRRVAAALRTSRDRTLRRVGECLLALMLAHEDLSIGDPRWLAVNKTTGVGLGVSDDERRIVLLGSKATSLGRSVVAECAGLWPVAAGPLSS